MRENNVVSARISNELLDWLNNKAVSKNCKTSDLVREAILTYKKLEELPEDQKYSDILHTTAARTTIMTYRLLENFVASTYGDKGIVIRDEALESAKIDVEKYKIDI